MKKVRNILEFVLYAVLSAIVAAGIVVVIINLLKF